MKKICYVVLLMLSPMLANAEVTQIDGVYYNLVKKAKVAEVTAGTNVYTGVVNIPETVEYENVTYKVTSIQNNAFANCGEVTAVTIGKNVTSIGEYAFSRCTGLTSLTIGSGVKEIGQYAFFECTSLATLTIPDNVTTMGISVLSGCTALTSVTLSANLTVLDVYAFYNCENLASITIPTSVTKIGEKAFSGCKGLTSLAIPTSVNEIGNSAFERCTGLTSMTIPSSVSTCGNGIFNGCTGLTSAKLPDTWTAIPNSTFKACTGLTSFTIPSGITEIEGSAFEGCSGLVSITIPSHVVTISGVAFSECTGLTTVVMEDGVKTIGNDAFRKCGNLTTLTLPQSLVSIGYQSFFDCKSLTTVIIPDNVTKIGDYAFRNCSGISNLTIGKSVEEIGNYAFENCSSLTKLVIPSSVSILNSSAFRNCSSLSSLTINEGVTKIMNNAFQNCSSLEEVTIPNTVIAVESGAFMDCTKLVRVNIGSGIKTVSSLAFSACENLEIVHCMATAVPYTFSDAFKDSYINFATLYVRGGCKAVYQANEVWNKFQDIFEIEPIKIGGSGFTTYTASYNLDFSGFGDEVKAYVATGYDYDAGTIWLTRVKDVPAGTPIMVKGNASQTYEVPVKLTSGAYYKNMFVANTTGETITLPATDGDMTNYYLSSGVFKTSTGTNTIGSGKCYLQIPMVAPTPVVGSSKDASLNKNGFASFCATQDLDFSDVEGLKAYAATGYDDASGTIWLTRVKRVSAGTGLLLMGAANGNYTIPSTDVKSYYANMMVGNTGTSDITIYTTSGDMTNYYLSGNKLLKAAGAGTAGNTIKPGRAYMQIPTAHVTRSIGDDPTENLSVYDLLELPEVISMQVMTRGFGGDGDTTGIREAAHPEQTNDVYYNLNGQRVNNPGKGLYIHNGKKVVIK